MLIVAILFWSSVAAIVFTYGGFPLLLAIRAWFRKRHKSTSYDSTENSIRNPAGGVPVVSVVIAAHNEQDYIRQKLDNIFSLDCDHTQLEVIVASDGSTDRTEELVSRYGKQQVRLLALPRQGKNATLNAAVSISRGEFLVFTDADTMMNKHALNRLLEPFIDPHVGAVGGDYRYLAPKTNSNEEKTYWNYDRILKKFQSEGGSMTSATGQIYAIRRCLFRPIPEKLVDDFYVSVQAPAAHYRLAFEPRAIAFGTAAEAGKPEFDRKVRVITGGLRTVWKMRRLLNPFVYGFYALQLFIHKVLRRLLVIPMFIAGVTSVVLWEQGWVYQLAAAGQFFLHGAAALGYLLRDHRVGRIKLFTLPFFFDLVNLASLVAFFQLLTGSRYDIWKPARTNLPADKAQELWST